MKQFREYALNDRCRPDPVDGIIGQWTRERPDLDVSPMAILGRVSRAEKLLAERMKAASARFGLERWGFDVLATLRRAGKPYRLTPTQLYGAMMLTSGAMTNRIDRLEESGFVKRIEDPDDRRGILVSLTTRGLKTIDAAVKVHMEVEESILYTFSAEERASLERLLRILLNRLEES